MNKTAVVIIGMSHVQIKAAMQLLRKKGGELGDEFILMSEKMFNKYEKSDPLMVGTRKLSRYSSQEPWRDKKRKPWRRR